MELNATKLINAVGADMRECQSAVVRYVAACLLAMLPYRLTMYSLNAWERAETYPVLSSTIRLGMAIYLAVAASAVMAVFFAELGVRVDRPIWKCAGPREALRRFFIPWLIINLATITLVDIQARLLVAEKRDAGAAIEMLILIVHLGAVPIGACIMHWGALVWSDIGSALKPMARRMPLALLPCAIAFLQYALMNLRALFLIEYDVTTFMTLLITDIPLLLMDLVIFIMTWRLCMHYRNMPDEEVDPFEL